MYRSSESISSNSNKIRTPIPIIETVEVHTTYVTKINMEEELIPPPVKKHPPTPLSRKSISQSHSLNYNKNNNLDCLQTFKNTKEVQNEMTKLQTSYENSSDDLSQSTYSSSRSKMPSTTRQKLFFAESKNDTIVSNTILGEPFSEKLQSFKHSVSSSSEEIVSRKKLTPKKIRRQSKSITIIPSKMISTTRLQAESVSSEMSTSIAVKRQRKPKFKKTAEETKSDKKFLYENLIGIFIHNTSELKFEKVLKKPRIKISCCDLEQRTFLSKSEIKRSVVTQSEPQDLDYIQPVISKGGTFKNFCSFIAEWEELILLNEDFNYIQNDKVIFFFELVDVIPISSKLFSVPSHHNQNGWYHVCWAFLKAYPQGKYSNLERRLQLQFYKYQQISNKKPLKVNTLPIFDQYINVNKLKTYPGILEVTIKGIIPNTEKIKGNCSGRPQNALESEFSGEIQSFTTLYLETKEIKGEIQAACSTADTLWTIKNHWQKLPGQASKCPNHPMNKILEQNNGSSVSKFNKSGDFLAYTYVTNENCFNITVISFPNFQEFINLSGHSNNIYDIDWMNNTLNNGKSNKSNDNIFPIHLVTSSADRTSIFWTIYNSNQYFYKILPHPSFVYLSKFLYFSNNSNSNNDIDGCIRIMTGGRDGILRIWKYDLNDVADTENYDKIFHLEIELKYHNHSYSYITGIICPERRDKFYSCDSFGEIIEWQLKLNHKQMQGLVARKFQFTDQITSMVLHPRNRKIFFNSNQLKNVIYIFDIESFHIIKSFPEQASTLVPMKFTISSCGNYLYQPQQTGDIQIFNMNSIKESTNESVEIIRSIFKLSNTNFISSIDFHPKDSFLCCSVYGVNGGVAIYEYEVPNDENANYRKRNNQDRNKQIESNNYHLSNNNNNLFKNNLIDIIHRIDKVFLNTTQTSATKLNNNNFIKANNLINVKYADSKLEIVIDKVKNSQIVNNYRKGNGNDGDTIDQVVCDDNNTDNDSNRTFSLPNDYESEIRNPKYFFPPATTNYSSGSNDKKSEKYNAKEEEHNNDENDGEINDQTFSMSKSIKNQTFSIEKSKVSANGCNNDDDATSISETLD